MQLCVKTTFDHITIFVNIEGDNTYRGIYYFRELHALGNFVSRRHNNVGYYTALLGKIYF